MSDEVQRRIAAIWRDSGLGFTWNQSFVIAAFAERLFVRTMLKYLAVGGIVGGALGFYLGRGR